MEGSEVDVVQEDEKVEDEGVDGGWWKVEDE